jgi:hypothetical protein
VTQNPRRDAPTLYGGLGNRLTSLVWPLPFYEESRGAQDSLNLKVPTAQRQAWLDSYERWPEKSLGESWVREKVLGMGSFGMAGLFELSEWEATKEETLRQVVVKQAGGNPSAIEQLRNEAEWLKKFSAIGTKHVVRMYKKIDECPGAGTMPELLVWTHGVHRTETLHGYIWSSVKVETSQGTLKPRISTRSFSFLHG